MSQKKMVWIPALILVFVFSAVGFLQAKGKDAKKEVKQEAKAGQEAKAATVNGTVISKAEVDKEFSRFERQMTMTGRPIDPEKGTEMRKQIRDDLIERELIKQEGKNLGIKVEEAEVNEKVAELKKRFPTEEEFTGAMSKMNLTEEGMKAQFGQELIIRKVIDQEVASKVNVSDDQTKSFYDGHPDLFKTPEMVRASHILLKLDEKATPEDKAKAREKLEGIKARIEKGEDFAALAKESSQCPSSANGGDLDFFKRGQMVPPFEEAAFGLQPGAMSGIVETQFGLHLIKVTEKKDPGVTPYDEIKDKIGQHLKQQEVGKQLEQYVAQLKSKAKIETFDK